MNRLIAALFSVLYLGVRLLPLAGEEEKKIEKLEAVVAVEVVVEEVAPPSVVDPLPEFDEEGNEDGLSEFVVYPREELKLGQTTSPLSLGTYQGVAFFAILYPTSSFPSVIQQVCKCGKKPELLGVDLHFNAGPTHGPMALTNTRGEEAGLKMVRALQATYCANGFNCEDRYYTLSSERQYDLGYLRRAREAGIAAVIAEPFCIDDCDLGPEPAKWSMTEEGVIQVAESYLRSLSQGPHRVVVLTVGHLGDRGTCGAKFQGVTECEYALRIINAIYRRLEPDHEPKLSAYSPQEGGDAMEGGYEAAKKGLDGKAVVRTIEDWIRGKSEYITIAANSEWYGRRVLFPILPFYYEGTACLLRNVPGYIHDTGSAFRGQPSNRFDIPIGKDKSNEQMVRNSSLWNHHFPNMGIRVMFRELTSEQE